MSHHRHPQVPADTFFSFGMESIYRRVKETMACLSLASAAAETIDSLARSIEHTSPSRPRLVFTHAIQSGYRRAYETGLITGHRLEVMDRLTQPFETIYQQSNCWGEIHSMERFRQRWQKLQRLFFSPSLADAHSAKNYVVFSHGNLLSGIISLLTSSASNYQWQFGNQAPHCSVSVLSYTSGDRLPAIVRSPFQIFNQTLPLTINNVNPRKMKLEEISSTDTLSEQNWKHLVDTVIPERVVGCHTDQIPLVSRAIPGNDDEARRIWLIVKQFHSHMIMRKHRLRRSTSIVDSDDEEDYHTNSITTAPNQ